MADYEEQARALVDAWQPYPSRMVEHVAEALRRTADDAAQAERERIKVALHERLSGLPVYSGAYAALVVSQVVQQVLGGDK